MPRPHLRTRRSNMHDIESALCHLHPPPSALHWTHAAHSSPNTRLARDLRVCPRCYPLQYLSLQHKSANILATHPRPAALSLSHELSYIPAHQLSALSYRPRTPICKTYKNSTFNMRTLQPQNACTHKHAQHIVSAKPHTLLAWPTITDPTLHNVHDITEQPNLIICCT